MKFVIDKVVDEPVKAVVELFVVMVPNKVVAAYEPASAISIPIPLPKAPGYLAANFCVFTPEKSERYVSGLLIFTAEPFETAFI